MNFRVCVQPKRRPVSLRCFTLNPRTTKLRELLQQPGIHAGPCCHDAISAKLIEAAGFNVAYMSGFCTSAAATGMPDTGLISYAEMQRVGHSLHEATSSIPIIGDGDTGYGNAMNVKRTVRGYAKAGFAGILIEDQVAPKSCGHVRDKQVVGQDEAVARIQAAVDAREEGSDILIVARTDARQAQDLDEALERAERFAAAGADVLFIDALESAEEMCRFTELQGAGRNVPKMASMLEGGGKTPLLSRGELANMNFKLVAYPLSLLGVSVRAMQRALVDLQEDRIPDSMVLPSFTELQDVIGFPQYFEEAERYSIHGTGAHSATSSNANTSSQPNNSPTDSSNGNKSGKVDAEKQPEGSTSGSRAAENASSTDARAAAEGTWTTSGAFRSFAESATSGTAGGSASSQGNKSSSSASGPGTTAAEILEALAESASAGIGISAAVMAIAKEMEPLMSTVTSSSGSGPFASNQKQGGRADRATQTPDNDTVSEEEFRGAEEWFREWRKRRSSGSDATSATANNISNNIIDKDQDKADKGVKGSSGTAMKLSDSIESESISSGSSERSAADTPKTATSSPADSSTTYSFSGAQGSDDKGVQPGSTELKGRTLADAIKQSVDAIEADVVIEPGATSTTVVTTTSRSQSEEQRKQRAKVDFSNVSLRILVTNTSTGRTTLDTTLPAQWMASVATMVPQLAGADLEEVIKQIQGGSWTPSDPVAQFPSGQELTSIYIKEN